MSFFNVNSKCLEGTVYVFKMVLDCGNVVYKVGITSRDRVEDRLGEVVLSFFSKYRYIPRTTVKRYRKSVSYEQLEREIHKELSIHAFEFDKTFGGCTEFFCADEDVILDIYDKHLS